MIKFRSGLFVITVAVGLLIGESAALGQMVELATFSNWGNYSTNATSGGLLWTNNPDCLAKSARNMLLVYWLPRSLWKITDDRGRYCQSARWKAVQTS